jgi:hypothetical protein
MVYTAIKKISKYHSHDGSKTLDSAVEAIRVVAVNYVRTMTTGLTHCGSDCRGSCI